MTIQTIAQTKATAFSHTVTASTGANGSALAGRIAIAAIFLLSGISKLLTPLPVMGFIASVGLPFPALAITIAILVEIGGGLMLVLGYRTRLVAAGLAIFSVVTALAFHNQLGDQNQFIHFFKNIAMAGGLVHVALLGGGRFSLDARR
jgi:putative oxidoreductase